MGIYIRKDSPDIWMTLKDKFGVRLPSRSTGIRKPQPHFTRELNADLKRSAQRLHAKTQAEIIEAGRDLLKKPARLLSEHIDWYLAEVLPLKRHGEREINGCQRMTRMLGSEYLHALTDDRIRKWMTERLKTIKKSSLAREMSLLRDLLTRAIPTYLDAHPMAQVSAPPSDDGFEAYVLSWEEEQALHNEIRKEDDRALCIIAMDTLVRMGNLLDVRWRDIRDRSIFIPKSKNGTAYSVALSTRARAALASLTKDDSGYVFWRRRNGTHRYARANKRPQQVASSGVHFFLKEACERAGIHFGRANHGFTFHGFRHTGATRLAQRGCDVRTLMAIANWKTIQMAARYVHASEHMARAAVEVIGQPEGRILNLVHEQLRTAPPMLSMALPLAGAAQGVA
jgi:integrase